MTTLGQARKVALALPETTEEPHHDMSSFRVRGKIFATVPDDAHLRVMVDEMEIRAAVAENPEACQEFYWGKRLACVVVDLKRAKLALVKDLLTDAWIRKAPAKLVKDLTDR
ncbi:MAG TPA: MmcQ/YjbR family DNA-binding protein [Acidimicrobiales bacterium]